MIKFGALPENINHFLPDVREYLSKHPNVLFAYLFGGLARGRVSPLSDVDIAIYLADGADIAQEKLETLGRLNEILKTDEVDLVILNTAPLPLAARIIKHKVILVDKMPFVRHKFESLIIRKYFDFSRKDRKRKISVFSHKGTKAQRFGSVEKEGHGVMVPFDYAGLQGQFG